MHNAYTQQTMLTHSKPCFRAEVTHLQDMLQCRVGQVDGKERQQGEGSIAHCTVWRLLGTLHHQAHVHSLQPGVRGPLGYILYSL